MRELVLFIVGFTFFAGGVFAGDNLKYNKEARRVYNSISEAKEQCEVNLPRSQQCVPVWVIEENNNDQ